ncbi:hypothetical protein N7488_007430 [Penicillium malachiteum]|nr:hypothetical protein N7488_007430 [Penicillium malachiteum]
MINLILFYYKPLLLMVPNLAIPSTRPAGPMARRLTTNQEIAGSTPASVNIFAVLPQEWNLKCGLDGVDRWV